MCKLLPRSRTWILAILTLCSVSFMGYAQSPRSEEVRAAKAEAKAAKLTPALQKVSKNKGVVPETSVDGLEVVEDYVIVDGAIAIEAVASNMNGQALLKALERLGLRDGKAHKGMVFGYMPIDKLEELANVSELGYARPFVKPATNAGSVTSQGDRALRSDIARQTYNVTGAGSKVGVLSDSYNFRGGAAAGVASGDLPAAGVQVLADYSLNNPTDEGRAMAEIVHDVAPGAAIAFNTAFGGQVGFANGIKALAAAGCNIIVDDVIYFAEPFFMDGIVAQAVDEVVNNNQVTYFSSAGNQARSSYQAGFVNSGQIIPGYGEAHNFGGGDIRQTITIPGLSTLRLFLQWDDPFRSVTGSAGAQTDLDILVYVNNILRTSFSSTADNLATGDPFEGIGLTNNGASPVNIEIAITKYAGPDPGIIKWVNFGSRNIVVEYDTKSSASYGHANAAGAISVGAAPYFNTPAYNPALTTAIIESFSSAGGTPTLLTISGDRIPNGGIIRQKPEITAADGGNNTFFGNDYEPDGFPNFFGTSASAPHSAGVAALMKERSGNNLSRNGILSIMQKTALDMDDPLTLGFDVGFDFRTGAGFIQADNAVLASSITDLAIAPTPAILCEGGSSSLVATFNGGSAPFTYTWQTTGGSITNTNTATATASNLPAGSQTITVTVTDANNLTSTNTTILTVNPKPVVSITPASSTILTGESVTLTASAGVSYLWSTTETTQAITVTPPLGINNYSVTVTDLNTCSNTATASVTVNLPGQLVLSGSSSVCIKSTPPAQNAVSIPVTLVLSGGRAPFTYNWAYTASNVEKNFKPIGPQGETIGKISFIPNGPTLLLNSSNGNLNGLANYMLRLTVTDADGKSVSFIVNLDGNCNLANARQGIVANENSIEGIQVIVVPNPIQDVLQLEVRGISAPVKVGLYDLQGRPQGEWTLQPIDGIGNLKANVSTLPFGLYILGVETEKGTVSQRVLKQK